MNGATEEIDLYEILSVNKQASKAEIKKAYHKAALAHHPDKVAPDDREAAEAKFKAASQAYQILHDDEKREMYDTHGMAAFDGSRGAGGPDLGDLFSMFGMGGMGGMGGMRGRGDRKAKKSPSERQKYEVTLDDLYKGKNVKFQSTKKALCPTCSGTGGKDKAKPAKCSVCKGMGARQVVRPIGPGTMIQETIQCSNCNGQGTLFNPKDKCKKCKGERVVEIKSQLEIYIPRGAKEGDTIVLEGEADHDPDAESPGDLIFHLLEVPHPIFTRGGADLTARIHITLAEALTGFQRVVLKHLDGRGIELRHPQHPGEPSVLRPADILRVRGEGMPHKRSDAKGDLYLQVHIEFPEDAFLALGPALSQTTALATKADRTDDERRADLLRALIPKPSDSSCDTPMMDETDEIDEVEYERDVSMEEFGGGGGQDGWEDDDDEAGPRGMHGAQCAQQ